MDQSSGGRDSAKTCEFSYKHVPTSLLRELKDVKSLPHINQIAGVSLLILETVEKVKSNREECNLMVEQVEDILHTIINFCLASLNLLHTSLLEALAKFTQTLQKIESFMRSQQETRKIKRLLKLPQSIAQLEDCKMSLQQAVDTFSMNFGIAQVSTLVETEANRKQQHQEVLDLSSFGWNFLRHLIRALSLLPNSPQIFHSREQELSEVVDLLLKDSSRVAVLGPAGIGKTSLARAALHHNEIVGKFEQRYFVSCESAVTVGDLQSAIAMAIGLEVTGKLSNAIITFLSNKSSCLLILDNFETPWKSNQSCGRVEAFLALLANIEDMALLITMRGLERPLNICWTRPFPAPLKPISGAASRRIFSDISDIENDPDLEKVLALTGYLPLAVTLIASVASVEGCKRNFATVEHPRMLSEPESLQLLSLLSVLPDSEFDDLLAHASLGLVRHKTTLLRTALAFIAPDGRLRSLPPIREFVKKNHGPTTAMAHRLRLYWKEALQLWRIYELPPGDMLNHLIQNVGNVASLLEWDFQNAINTQDLEDIAYGILDLDQFSLQVVGSRSPLRDIFTEICTQLKNAKLQGLLTKGLFSEPDLQFRFQRRRA
ncbi:P-loop containing nucleoside triphosphate hydrolase protein [Mycena crocata]|nr:P-loop containing nucleoside triphosphate hydrolase protein [Mycena crocata]